MKKESKGFDIVDAIWCITVGIIVGIFVAGAALSPKLEECQKENAEMRSTDLCASQRRNAYLLGISACDSIIEKQLPPVRECAIWENNIPCSEKNLIAKPYPLVMDIGDGNLSKLVCEINDSNAVCTIPDLNDLQFNYSWEAYSKPMIFFTCCTCWSDEPCAGAS